ncbi:hypothetical protein PS1_028401 [Malus domestica]
MSRSAIAGRGKQAVPYRCRTGAAIRAERARMVSSVLKPAREVSDLLMNRATVGLEEESGFVSCRRAVSEG